VSLIRTRASSPRSRTRPVIDRASATWACASKCILSVSAGAVERRPALWKLMAEADRVFPARKGQGSQTLTSEKRFIQGRPRRDGGRSSQTRVVEVVHVRRVRSGPAGSLPCPPAWSVRSETWSEGSRAQPVQPSPSQGIQPVASEPAPPVVHVMPMWEPSPPQPTPSVAPPDEPLVGPAKAKRPSPRSLKAGAPKETARHFADPFAADDGANCLRCGYLVESAREKQGLLTCSVCG
jgi:hypothetical protein